MKEAQTMLKQIERDLGAGTPVSINLLSYYPDLMAEYESRVDNWAMVRHENHGMVWYVPVNKEA